MSKRSLHYMVAADPVFESFTWVVFESLELQDNRRKAPSKVMTFLNVRTRYVFAVCLFAPLPTTYLQYGQLNASEVFNLESMFKKKKPSLKGSKTVS